MANLYDLVRGRVAAAVLSAGLPPRRNGELLSRKVDVSAVPKTTAERHCCGRVSKDT